MSKYLFCFRIDGAKRGGGPHTASHAGMSVREEIERIEHAVMVSGARIHANQERNGRVFLDVVADDEEIAAQFKLLAPRDSLFKQHPF